VAAALMFHDSPRLEPFEALDAVEQWYSLLFFVLIVFVGVVLTHLRFLPVLRSLAPRHTRRALCFYVRCFVRFSNRSIDKARMSPIGLLLGLSLFATIIHGCPVQFIKSETILPFSHLLST